MRGGGISVSCQLSQRGRGPSKIFDNLKVNFVRMRLQQSWRYNPFVCATLAISAIVCANLGTVCCKGNKTVTHMCSHVRQPFFYGRCKPFVFRMGGGGVPPRIKPNSTWPPTLRISPDRCCPGSLMRPIACFLGDKVRRNTVDARELRRYPRFHSGRPIRKESP